MTKLKNLLIFTLLANLLVSCNTSKGYLGAKLPNEELATIHCAPNLITMHDRKYIEYVVIEKIDSIQVGSSLKGWSKNLKVKPGEHLIELRHFKPKNYLYASSDNETMTCPFPGTESMVNLVYPFRIKLTVEKNHSYLLRVETFPNSLNNPKIEILKVSDNKNMVNGMDKNLVRKNQN